jgi:hypothetical protein
LKKWFEHFIFAPLSTVRRNQPQNKYVECGLLKRTPAPNWQMSAAAVPKTPNDDIGTFGDREFAHSSPLSQYTYVWR